MPMIVKVTGVAARVPAAGSRRTCVVCLEHSGHRIPTDVEVMQSVQIGRSQFEQETPVSRLGWR